MSGKSGEKIQLTLCFFRSGDYQRTIEISLRPHDLEVRLVLRGEDVAALGDRLAVGHVRRVGRVVGVYVGDDAAGAEVGRG